MKNKSYLAWPNSFHFSNVSTDTAVIIKDYIWMKILCPILKLLSDGT